MTEQWSFRATGGSGRTIVTKESVVPPWIPHKSIFGGIEAVNAVVKEGRDMMLENKLQHSGDETVQRRVIDCLSLGDDE